MKNIGNGVSLKKKNNHTQDTEKALTAGIYAWIDDNKNLVDAQWVEVNSAKDQKKGSIKYSTPEFTMGANLKPTDADKADSAAAKLKSHLDTYFNKEDAVEVTDFELDF